MEQGRFEDIVKKKFEGKGRSVPSNIWENVNSALDADLVSQYQSSHSRYRWFAVAAMFIAAFSFAFQYLSFEKNKSEQEVEVSYYNALLSDDDSFSMFQFTQSYIVPSEFNRIPITFSDSKRDEGDEVILDDLTKYPKLDSIALERRKPRIELAETDGSIHYYRVIGNLPILKKSSKSEFWAGLEAGAGKFNSNFNGNNSLSNSVNSDAAATAIGANEFSNPSATAIRNEMQEGTATSVGFDFGMKLGKRWTLESGLAYTSINNTGTASINIFDAISSQDPILTSNTKPEDPNSFENERARGSNSIDGDVVINNNIQFASMPLKAGYYLMDDRFSLRLNAGFSANYLIENSLYDPSREIINSSNHSLYNDWSFDGIGGLEFGYRLFGKIDMTVEPNYRYSITPLSNSISSPRRFVVQTGLRYTLR